MIFDNKPAPINPLRAAIDAAYLADETACVEALLPQARLDHAASQRVAACARELVEAVRAQRQARQGIEAFMHEYDLSSEEGVVLMCLAEALLRIPDSDTADRLIRDKLAGAQWQRHLGQSHSLFVNASTWGLMLTGRMVKLQQGTVADTGAFLRGLIARSGEPLVRAALKQGMRIMARQFVMGRSIEEALERSRGKEHCAYRHSFDMLGEAALTGADAQRYFAAYSHAIDALGAARGEGDVFTAAGISVKLSALHPRYEFAQRERVMDELVPMLLALAERAKAAGIGLTMDAEEADRLGLSLDVFEAVLRTPALGGWEGFGLALQAYQKRAIHVVEWLAALAGEQGRRIPVRLVKGAYWDTEIKRAQERGLSGYPVFTRKPSTDVSYLACARRILAAPEAFYPQFATHNAHTVASILAMAEGHPGFEFQRLHGMGEALYDHVVAENGAPCRVYAPVGSHEDLLPYLVRRLLENGANTSFVHRIEDPRTPVEDIIADPVAKVVSYPLKPHPRIALPADLYAPARRNSAGLNLNDEQSLEGLGTAMNEAIAHFWQAAPLVGGETMPGTVRELPDPSDHSRIVGSVAEADEAVVEKTMALAAAAAPDWARTPAAVRAEVLERAADLFEEHRAELMALIVRNGGRTVPDALSEVREAADFCRYYAWRAREDFAGPLILPGPTGESNRLTLHGRGVFACISPWNFPLAIFAGQIVAALAAGNAVIAKPAGQTPLVAMHATRLLHQAGVPVAVLHLLPGKGSVVGPKLLADPRISGVAFTGSTETARAINLTLAQRPGPIVPFIAETGGQNAMIVDSSALPEQAVPDILQSAFNSAGQRCSALRVLFVQEQIAPRLQALLLGAMAELRLGDPGLLSTDVGPVIDAGALATLSDHVVRMRTEGRLAYQMPLPEWTGRGTYFPPSVVTLASLAALEKEVFGPVLHVIRYAAGHLDDVIEAINATGYGLTLGIHSRVDSTIDYIRHRVRAGNVYVNRNMIGAVVGVQPFGGEGLSGTGPKAGGPHYLHRFATEHSVAVNTAALGGNTQLLSLQD